jgi:hypothetical protein
MIIIITRGEHFVVHLDGLGGTQVAHHCVRAQIPQITYLSGVGSLEYQKEVGLFIFK